MASRYGIGSGASGTFRHSRGTSGTSRRTKPPGHGTREKGILYWRVRATRRPACMGTQAREKERNKKRERKKKKRSASFLINTLAFHSVRARTRRSARSRADRRRRRCRRPSSRVCDRGMIVDNSLSAIVDRARLGGKGGEERRAPRGCREFVCTRCRAARTRARSVCVVVDVRGRRETRD